MMFHAHIMPIATCFIHTLYPFYAFSGTNLLTRCHSASSRFLLFLVSEKLFCKYPRNRTKQIAKFLFFPTRSRSPKERRRGAARRRPHPMARVGPLPRHQVGSEPRGSTDAAPSPIYSPRRENPKTPSHYSRKHPLPPPSTLTRGVLKFSSGTLPERGIITGGLYIAMPASGVTGVQTCALPISKRPSHISRKHPLPPPSTLTRGVQKFSSGTLPERGIDRKSVV